MLKGDKSFSNCANRSCNGMKGQQVSGLSGNKFADSGKYNSTKLLKPEDLERTLRILCIIFLMQVSVDICKPAIWEWKIKMGIYAAV